MPLSVEDHVAILRHLQEEVRRIDPELHALVLQHVEPGDNPSRYLLDYLSALTRLMSERSAGSHGRVLNILNESLRTESGAPVRSLRLVLAPTERELLRREHMDLADLPDRTELVEELKSLHRAIAQDLMEGRDRG